MWWGIVTLLVAAAAFWRATTTTRMTEETLNVTRMPEAAVGGATASPGATEETPSVARMPEAASPSTQAVTEAPDGGVLDPPLQMDAHDSPSSAGPYGRGRKGATRKPSRRPAKVAGVRLTLGTMKDVSSSDVPALAQALRASLRRQLKQETGLTLTRDDPQYVMSAVLRTLTFRISKSVKTTVTLECSATLSRAAGGGLRFSTSARASLEADEALTGSARRAAAVEALDECVGSLREDVGAYLRSTGGKSPKRRRR